MPQRNLVTQFAGFLAAQRAAHGGEHALLSGVAGVLLIPEPSSLRPYMLRSGCWPWC